MAETVQTAAPSFERDDIELVKLFLTKYKDAAGNSYHLAERPDVTERKAKAIEAVAVDEHGRRLAIEHTMVEAFAGKRADDVPFLAAFEQLRLDKSLALPDRFIDVQCPALTIPRGEGIDWKDVGQKVLKWFKEMREKFPADGQSWHKVPDAGFDLRVLVETMSVPGTNGGVVVSRILRDDRPFIDVLHRALANKVPKLIETTADKHILLLEDEGTAVGFYKVTQGIDASAKESPQLKKVDEVWVVKTMGWKTSGDLFFYYVWPGGVKERLRIQDERFRRK
jgi:hypothetical protein